MRYGVYPDVQYVTPYWDPQSHQLKREDNDNKHFLFCVLSSSPQADYA